MARAVSGPYPDPRADIGSMAAFDLEPVRKFKKPITLDQMRRDKTFANWELLRISRLSVMLVPEEIWARVMKLSGSK
jgi:predicted RNA-binding protein with PUA-like domain